MADTAIGPDQAAVPGKLSSLPVELKTEILSYLDVATIAQCRRISRQFSNIIGEPKNESAIYTRGLNNQYARLDDEAAALFQYSMDGPDAFISALKVFHQHRGFALDKEFRFVNADSFVELWNMREKQRCEVVGEEYDASRKMKIEAMVYIMGEEFMSARGCLDDFCPRSLGISYFIQTFWENATEPWMQDKDAVTKLYDHVRDLHGLFEGAEIYSHEDYYYCPMGAFVTSLTSFADGFLQKMCEATREPFCCADDLADAVEVPSLAEGFAYTVSYIWSHGRLEEWQLGGSLTMEEKVFILEDLRIF